MKDRAVKKSNSFERIIRIVFVGLAVCGAVTTAKATTRDSSRLCNEIIIDSPNEGLSIPTMEIPAMEEAALQGSAKDARRLAVYYGRIVHSSKDQVYWMTIAAENGDLEARFDVALTLSNSTDRHDQIRARYWLERIVREGPQDLAERARYGLQNLDMIEKYRSTHKSEN